MRFLLVITAFSCVSFAAFAQDAQPTTPPTQALPQEDSTQPGPPQPVFVKPTPLDQKKFDTAAAAYDAKDYDTAYRLFTELADDYDVAAMRNVALMTRDGLGCEKDPQKAEDMMEEAAKRGLPSAQYDLGQMLLDGAAGDPDPKAAVPWLELSATAGHPVAQYRLAQLYEEGTVVPQDRSAAILLYAESARHGYAPALKRLMAIKGWKTPPKELYAPATRPPRALIKQH